MKKAEIWLLEIPSKNGHEQAGTRPGIVIATTNIEMVTVIPLTSNQLATRFPHVCLIKKSLHIQLISNDC